jgi:hypothetical protein
VKELFINLKLSAMKKRTFVLFAFLLTVGLSGQLFAQETMGVSKSKTKSNQSNDRSVEQNTAVCTGKIRCADGSCTISFEQEIVSPRDAASGLPTGKRQHKPFVITKELDKSSPTLAKGGSGMGSGKVSMSDLSVMIISNGRSTKLPVINDQFTLPSDGRDNDCDLIVSWSWGESNTGSSVAKRYEATFNLSVENGEYMASKHTKTGHVTLMK